MFLTLMGEAMSAMTRSSSAKGAKISFGETFGSPSPPTVASQQRTAFSISLRTVSFSRMQISSSETLLASM